MSASQPKAPLKPQAGARRDGPNSSVQLLRFPWLVNRPFLVSLLLATITLAVYWQVAGFDFINFDDHEYVVENHFVTDGLTWRGVVWAFCSWHTANWHPLTWLSHMLDVDLFGRGAAGPHVVNLLFHIANTILLFLLLKLLTRTFWRSAFVAALFALHPLHVESVAWVSERKDVLSTFFGFLSLLFYTRYAQTKIQNSKFKIQNFLMSLFFFACGLMSKPMLVTLPFVMLLLDFWPLQRFTIRDSRLSFPRLVWEKLPFFLLSAISCVVTFAVQREGGAVSHMAGLPLSMRFQTALVSYARYLGKIFWPVDLALPYPYPLSWPAGQVIFSAALVVALCGAAIWAGRRKPYVFVGWFWFWGTLIPVIGLVQVGVQSMADRYTYVPLIGIFIIVVWSVGELVLRRPALKPVFCALGALVLCTFALQTSVQVGYWRDSRTLFSHSVAVTKDNDIAYSLLGHYYLEKEQVDEATDNYRKALQTVFSGVYLPSDIFSILSSSNQPTAAPKKNTGALLRANPKKLKTLAEVMQNLGTILHRKGKSDEAMEYYRASLLINPDNAFALSNLASELAARKEFALATQLCEDALRKDPNQPLIRSALGVVLTEAGRGDEAIVQYREALRLSPNDAETHFRLGLMLVAQGQAGEAIPHYEAALRANPKMTEIHNCLGTALISVGRFDEAIQQFHLLLKTKPNQTAALVNLAIALASKGQFEESASFFRQAIRMQPDNANTHYNLANVLASQRKFDEAIVEYREALRLSPDHVQAHCNFGVTLAELGRRDEAISQLREALRINPDFEQAKQQLQKMEVP